MLFQRQNLCLDQRATAKDEIVCSTFVAGVRVYTSFADKDEFARFILGSSDGHDMCNELLWTHSYGYLDLDSPNTLEQLGWGSQEAFISAFNELLVYCHKEHLGVDMEPRNMLWSTSSREGKTSYHIKIDVPYYWPEAVRKTQMKDFFRIVDQKCRDTKGMHWFVTNGDDVSQQCLVDLSVYSANRCFRAIGNRKPDSDVLFMPIGSRVSHSAIVSNLLTVVPEEVPQMTPFVLKSKCKVVQHLKPVSIGLIQELAHKYGAEYQDTKGSLILLRNKGCRICPIGNETNRTDHCFFILKNRGSTVYFGCHNSECSGTLLKVHESERSSKYSHYNDYELLLKAENADVSDVQEYMRDVVKFVDKTTDPFFVCTGKNGVRCFDNKVVATNTNCSKTLFRGYSDIVIPGEEPIRFSKVLGSLLAQRQIPTYTDAVWYPFLKKNPIALPAKKLNLFQGFALEHCPPSNIDFEKTQLYDLIHKLAGGKPEPLNYLLNFIAAKLQYPSDKKPVCLCFINSKEGTGKGSFGLMLQRMFSCGTNSYISFNSLAAFANSFNGIKSRALFICLEEITAKKNCLREYNGYLKDQISSTEIMEEIKNRERSLKPWFASIIVFSNEFNVMSCSRTDRRLAMFESINTQANNKKYFEKLHHELDSVQHMKAAFDYFAKRDTSDWNYRLLPDSKMKQKLTKVSERATTKFFRHLFDQCLQDQKTYWFSEEELYSYYKDYVELYGVGRRSDRSYVCSNFELTFDIPKDSVGTYCLEDTDRRKYLKTLR